MLVKNKSSPFPFDLNPYIQSSRVITMFKLTKSYVPNHGGKTETYTNLQN